MDGRGDLGTAILTNATEGEDSKQGAGKEQGMDLRQSGEQPGRKEKNDTNSLDKCIKM